MASSKSDEKRAAAYFQDNGALKNKFGITNQKILEKAEAISAEVALSKGLSATALDISVNGLKQMHKELFGSVYDWAGEFRDYTTGRGAPFCVPQFIEPSLNKIYKKVNQEIQPNMEKETFVKSAAEFIGELNSIHPFIDGNGRTQRQSLDRLAIKAGYTINSEKLNRKEWYEAAKECHLTASYKGFEKIISNTTEQKMKNEKIITRPEKKTC